LEQGVSGSADIVGCGAAAAGGDAGVAGLAGMAAVISVELASVAALAVALAASFGEGAAATVAGIEAMRACGEAVQYQIATIRLAETTVATIRPSAPRMLLFSTLKKCRNPERLPGLDYPPHPLSRRCH
jgi:hypothetical protein